MSHSDIIELQNAPMVLDQYRRGVLQRKPGLRDGSIGRIEAHRRGVIPTAGHVDRYREVCGFASSAHLPITYPHMLAFSLHMEILISKAFPVPLLGLVHVHNSIEQWRPISPHEVLDVQCVMEGHRALERGAEFDVITRIHSAQELVWQSTSTMLARSRAAGKKGSSNKVVPQIPAMEQQQQWQVPENTGRRYALVSGDSNLIHMWALTAKAFGFKRAIAHGMWTKGRCAAALSNATPAERARLAVDFKMPLFLPSTVTMRSQATATGTDFDVRDAKGIKPHLVGSLSSF